eukprot:2216246-Pleurochrysis_carterae.AAC.1
MEERLERDNAEYAERRAFRANVKSALARGDREELIDLRHTLIASLSQSQHLAAHDHRNRAYHTNDIRRYAMSMSRLDGRERELGLPPSNEAALKRPMPPTPGFRGYFVEGRAVTPDTAAGASSAPTLPINDQVVPVVARTAHVEHRNAPSAVGVQRILLPTLDKEAP